MGFQNKQNELRKKRFTVYRILKLLSDLEVNVKKDCEQIRNILLADIEKKGF
jgi:hypothetical protein